MEITRYFTKPGQTYEDVLNSVEWHTFDVEQKHFKTGEVLFRQENVEFPKFWDYKPAEIVASKYFWGKLGTDEREYSLKQLITRVIVKITNEACRHGYFEFLTPPTFGKTANQLLDRLNIKNWNDDANAFAAELTYLVLHQHFMWNSPVWFNIGTPNRQSVSACFITQVDDNLESIIENIGNEMLIFRDGSGNGFNASSMRGSKENLSGGGTSSGPISFMKVHDVGAMVTKSGGKTRRAAKMVILDVDHPDIEEFITCKSDEERKAKALAEAGYDGGPGEEAYNSVFFQNANHSVRISDEFLKAVEEDDSWHLINRKDGTVAKSVNARELWDKIAREAWETGDPGIQFGDTINKWNTCRNDGEIVSSNPCGEYLFLNNTSCNLGSINLIKYWEKSAFNVARFLHTIRLAFISMNVLIDFAEYPTEKITTGTKKYRTIGLGYANVGALLMSMGIPYDSALGRAVILLLADAITAFGYVESLELAKIFGPFEAFERNTEHMRAVLSRHRNSHHNAFRRRSGIIDDPGRLPAGMSSLCRDISHAWDKVLFRSQEGFRNAQVSVLAPTGTIGLAMDCDTTGIEPELDLVKFKTLVGGARIKYVNKAFTDGLKSLGYTPEEISKIANKLHKENRFDIKAEHKHIFACSLGTTEGVEVLPPEAHVEALGAVAPFLSGSASKTVNLPHDTTVEDIKRVYTTAHKLGVKCVSIYRDGSKLSQPLSTEKKEEKPKFTMEDASEMADEIAKKTGLELIHKPSNSNPQNPKRKEMPTEREGKIHSVQLNGSKAYFTLGEYEDGSLGEVFINMSRQGSFANGLMDFIGILISLALQHGVPLKDITRKMKQTKFTPAGFTGNKEFPQCNSMLDYLGQLLEKRYVDGVTKKAPKTQVPVGFAVAASIEDGRIEEVVPYKPEHIIHAEPIVPETIDGTYLRSGVVRMEDPYEPEPYTGHTSVLDTIEKFGEQTNTPVPEYSGNPCPECGSEMYLLGKCHRCLECGTNGDCGG